MRHETRFTVSFEGNEEMNTMKIVTALVLALLVFVCKHEVKSTTEKPITESTLEELKTIWIFGYGSLLWNPDVKYRSQRKGYIRGYVRRFWQENITHRGTPDRPGRVVTLVKEDGGIVWGVAYEVKGHDNIKEAIRNLHMREVRDGFKTVAVDFYPESENGQESRKPYKVLVYIATPENTLYKRPSDTKTLAKQIAGAKGFMGSNVDYVLMLADYVRTHIPEDKDPHLFELEKYVKAELLHAFLQ